MVSWVLIIGLVVVLFIFFKIKDFKHRFVTIALIIVLVFLYLTFTNVTSGIDLSSVEGVMEGGRLYLSWLGGAFKNIVSITSHAVEMDWGGNFTR